MQRTSRNILLSVGLALLVSAGSIAFLSVLRTSNDEDARPNGPTRSRTPTTLLLGTCKTARGLFGDTSCNPTPAQVTAASGVPVPASATEFSATYESFQDWILESSFRVSLDLASVYTSLPAYPGIAVDGPEIEGTSGGLGEYRKLKLVTVDGMLQVTITVFTT
jgi:hypothetical protein